VGVVAATAPGVRGVAPGQPVCTMTYGGFAEWAVVSERHVFPVPEATPQMAALMTSGLTASIALEQAGLVRRSWAPRRLRAAHNRAASYSSAHLRAPPSLAGLQGTELSLPSCCPSWLQRKGQTVLVTAAAGGTGQLAVQLAALAGCHVIGTCSGGDKETLLRSLGCHRVVNYRRERLREVLKAEYPRGLDLVYESGGLGWQQAAAVPPPSALPPARDQLDAAVPRADAPRPGRPAHLPTRPLCSGRGDV
jgi:NADPH:quinone reductase-like Zn-dependent oxidoreductase